MNTKKQIELLIKLIGGKDNIASVSHCITRLRFVLKETEKADADRIEAEVPAVKGCFTNGGQFQVIIGTDVGQYYQELLQQANIDSSSKNETKQAAKANMSLFERALTNLAELFVPVLPAIITGGLILGFRNIMEVDFSGNGALVNQSQFWMALHQFLWLIGEAVFHFLPVAICWSTVKKLGGSPVLGIILGITLVSPQLMNAYGIGSQIPEVWDFGFFTMEKVGYQAQVIPAIMAGVFLAMLEVRLSRIIPSYLHQVLVPLISVTAAVFVAHALIGPVGRAIGDAFGQLVLSAMTGDYGVIFSSVFGFLYAPLVITGIHHTTNAVDMQLFQTIGGTPVFPMIALSNIAQGSAVVGVLIASRKKSERDVSIPAAISAYLGVTEPAMYGINLKYKFPMLCAMVGSAIAAGVCGLSGVLSNGIGNGGILGILSIQPQFWTVFLVAMAFAIIIPIVLTVLVFKYQQKRTNKLSAKEQSNQASPAAV
ncbi:PTS trehalose transporter subunit IIBC [Psychromonas ossibalaenae]|uniref:PTS trehalose transporter subunit IIBC n=1 Tax=Psychromonas ossibalaenae TaxID=444922 RepID=UPI00037E6653|nr:PTS trehalose transporter subunit IIBC [Psychromonas ossibalaenae]